MLLLFFFLLLLPINRHGTPPACFGRSADRILGQERPTVFGAAGGWSSSEVREIVRAARRNTHVKNVAVVPREMENGEPDPVAVILQNLPCIAEFQIEATEILPYAEIVDKLLFSTESFTTHAVSLTRFFDSVFRRI